MRWSTEIWYGSCFYGYQYGTLITEAEPSLLPKNREKKQICAKMAVFSDSDGFAAVSSQFHMILISIKSNGQAKYQRCNSFSAAFLAINMAVILDLWWTKNKVFSRRRGPKKQYFNPFLVPLCNVLICSFWCPFWKIFACKVCWNNKN